MDIPKTCPVKFTTIVLVVLAAIQGYGQDDSIAYSMEQLLTDPTVYSTLVVNLNNPDCDTTLAGIHRATELKEIIIFQVEPALNQESLVLNRLDSVKPVFTTPFDAKLKSIRLPDRISECRNLQTIYARDCLSGSLPHTVVQLQNLSYLDIGYVETSCESLSHLLVRLQELNFFYAIPRNVSDKCTEELLTTVPQQCTVLLSGYEAIDYYNSNVAYEIQVVGIGNVQDFAITFNSVRLRELFIQSLAPGIRDSIEFRLLNRYPSR